MNRAGARGNGPQRPFGGGALDAAVHLLEGRTPYTDWSDA